MRLLALLLLPLAISAPAPAQQIKELSVNQWGWVQSALSGGIDKLSGWTWRQASQVVESIEVSEDKSDQTIWQQLKADPHSFSKLVKVIEFEGGEAIKYLDGDKKITFFAPNNDALTPPKHRHHGHHDHRGHHGNHDEDLAELISNPSLASISDLIETDPSFTSYDDKEPDDDDKNRRREMIRKLVGKVLQYHGLPEALTAVDVAKNSTLATALVASDGSYGGLARRLKVKKTLIPPAIKLNFYAQILATDRKASNGYFHTLSAPLIPPPSIFESTYLFPDIYSTFTSVAQALGEDDRIRWEYHHEHDEEEMAEYEDADELDSMLSTLAMDILHELGFKDDSKYIGTPLATVFVPTNSAFAILPPRLKFYLFSPFGRRALWKILAYHYVYDSLILTEFQYFGKGYPLPKKGHGEEITRTAGEDGFSHTFDVTTATNQTLHIQVEKKKVLPIDGAYKNTLKVNGIETLENDVPARNGAFHPIGLLLIPPHHHHDHHGQDISAVDSWENWEEWLPQWADVE